MGEDTAKPRVLAGTPRSGEAPGSSAATLVAAIPQATASTLIPPGRVERTWLGRPPAS
jgi:hypothetical protein